jgi:cytochrome b pre-mRNA-processing protein 3
MLVLYLWLCLCRVRAEGKDGAAVGQSLYDAFNHDLEKRIIATGLKVLLSKWMKELEKNFYGSVTAYDAAMKPDAAQDELSRALWRYMPNILFTLK